MEREKYNICSNHTNFVPKWVANLNEKSTHWNGLCWLSLGEWGAV